MTMPGLTDKMVTNANNVERGDIQMKSVSILQILTGIQKVGMCDMYRKSVVAKTKTEEKDGAETVVDVPKPQGDYVAESDDAWIVYVLTAVGQEVVDVFATLDAINTLNTDITTLVDGEHKVDEYMKLPCFDMFIRPAKAVIAGETQGIRQLDNLTSYTPFCTEFKGEVLSPAMFENAQLRYLRTVNRKCSALVGATSVKRDKLVLTEDVILSMPIILDGKLQAVTRGKKFEVFALKQQFYPTKEYIVSYNYVTVDDAMMEFGKAFTAAANGRVESTSEQG